ncbi:unnamed protein product [Triticum turgidum subsp. durum]|uniref:Uncharacterized protein n=2 Tax=Triticum TaxID=4564 RepID=A0A9R0TAE5_TRITD|nr:unnamed protein product [Triticum turgidum subsp. durum]
MSAHREPSCCYIRCTPRPKIHPSTLHGIHSRATAGSVSVSIWFEWFFGRLPMADIAMLVADEAFEKRLQRGAPFAGAGEEASKGRENFGAVAKVWGSWASGVKVRVALLVKADVAEPKTPVAMAAFDGLFSA